MYTLIIALVAIGLLVGAYSIILVVSASRVDKRAPKPPAFDPNRPRF